MDFWPKEVNFINLLKILGIKILKLKIFLLILLIKIIIYESKN